MDDAGRQKHSGCGCCVVCRVCDQSSTPSTVGFRRSNTQRVGHGVSQVMLLVDTCEQVRHRSRGVHGDVFTAVCLVAQRHTHRLLKLGRLCTYSTHAAAAATSRATRKQESPADAGIPARRKNDERNSSISKL